MEVSAPSQTFLTRGTEESDPLFSKFDYEPCCKTHLTTFAVSSGHEFDFFRYTALTSKSLSDAIIIRNMGNFFICLDETTICISETGFATSFIEIKMIS